MHRRVFVLFCLLTAVTSQDPQKPVITVDEGKMLLTCKDGAFGESESKQISYENSGIHECTSVGQGCGGTCPKALVKILSSENLIELNVKDIIIILISDILVTVLIGWAIYSICAQPMTRASYQGNKASDRQALINNHAPSGGDTYQRLNTRQDEYSTLHAPRKHKNKQSV